MSSGDDVVGDEPLVDGMLLSLRLRRDFTVTDAARLLAAARRTYGELHPDATSEDAVAAVTCAADALYVVLEHAGIVGDAVDDRLASHEADGLAVAGWRAEVTVNEPSPLPARPRCVAVGDVFALPASEAVVSVLADHRVAQDHDTSD